MLKVILKEEKTILLSSLPDDEPMIARLAFGQVGVFVSDGGDCAHYGWILKRTGKHALGTYHKTRKECIKSALRLGFQLFVEEQ